MSHLSLELERLTKSAPVQPDPSGGANSRTATSSSHTHTHSLVRRVDYEWFATARNCEPLVRALVDWLGWVAPSDLTKFCERLPFQPSTKVADWSEEEAGWLDALEASKRRSGEWRAYYDDGTAMRLLDLG